MPQDASEEISCETPNEGSQPLLSSHSLTPPHQNNGGQTIIDYTQDELCTVGKDRGYVCYCAGVECVFEMILYRYKHKQETYESSV